MLRVRIAANILYRISIGCQILKVDSEIYDLVIVILNEELRFAIKVGSSTMSSNNAFSEYIQKLEDTDFEQVKERIPIALMCVNESTEDA